MASTTKQIRAAKRAAKAWRGRGCRESMPIEEMEEVLAARGIDSNTPAAMEELHKHSAFDDDGRQIVNLPLEQADSILTKAVTGTTVVPNWSEFITGFRRTFESVRDTVHGGTVASYIPALAQQPRHWYAASVCTVDGQTFDIGDSDVEFSIQSCVKPFIYSVAVEDLGLREVHKHVGIEPSGLAFNEIELNAEQLPHNPMINSGAIAASSCLGRGKDMASRFRYFLDRLRAMAGDTPVGFSQSTYLGEHETAWRNNALVAVMQEAKVFPRGEDPKRVLDFYLQACSCLVNTTQAATLAATLANGGVCPLTNKRVLSNSTVKSAITLAFSCGMYDYSGTWITKVGLPAKSGVAGLIYIVIPHVAGIAVFSPPLDEHGNSVRGVAFFEKLVQRLPFGIFQQIVADGLATLPPPRFPHMQYRMLRPVGAAGAMTAAAAAASGEYGYPLSDAAREAMATAGVGAALWQQRPAAAAAGGGGHRHLTLSQLSEMHFRRGHLEGDVSDATALQYLVNFGLSNRGIEELASRQRRLRGIVGSVVRTLRDSQAKQQPKAGAKRAPDPADLGSLVLAGEVAASTDTGRSNYGDTHGDLSDILPPGQIHVDKLHALLLLNGIDPAPNVTPWLGDMLQRMQLPDRPGIVTLERMLIDCDHGSLNPVCRCLLGEGLAFTDFGGFCRDFVKLFHTVRTNCPPDARIADVTGPAVSRSAYRAVAGRSNGGGGSGGGGGMVGGDSRERLSVRGRSGPSHPRLQQEPSTASLASAHAFKPSPTFSPRASPVPGSPQGRARGRRRNDSDTEEDAGTDEDDEVLEAAIQASQQAAARVSRRSSRGGGGEDLDAARAPVIGFGRDRKRSKSSIVSLLHAVRENMRHQPGAFAAAVCTVDGQQIAVGDSQTFFPLMDCVRPLLYALALEDTGTQTTHAWVGMEPTSKDPDGFELLSAGQHKPLLKPADSAPGSTASVAGSPKASSGGSGSLPRARSSGGPVVNGTRSSSDRGRVELDSDHDSALEDMGRDGQIDARGSGRDDQGSQYKELSQLPPGMRLRFDQHMLDERIRTGGDRGWDKETEQEPHQGLFGDGRSTIAEREGEGGADDGDSTSGDEVEDTAEARQSKYLYQRLRTPAGVISCDPVGASHDPVSLGMRDHPKPYNPFTLCGALVTATLVGRGHEAHEHRFFRDNGSRVALVLERLRDLAGGVKLSFNNPCYLSLKQKALRTVALANFLKGMEALPARCAPDDTANFLNQCCAIEMDVSQLACVAATIAHVGVSPQTQKRCLRPSTVKSVMSLLYACGLNASTGKWQFNQGLVACASPKTGVTMVIVPNVMGIAIFAPPSGGGPSRPLGPADGGSSHRLRHLGAHTRHSRHGMEAEVPGSMQSLAGLPMSRQPSDEGRGGTRGGRWDRSRSDRRGHGAEDDPARAFNGVTARAFKLCHLLTAKYRVSLFTQLLSADEDIAIRDERKRTRAPSNDPVPMVLFFEMCCAAGNGNQRRLRRILGAGAPVNMLDYDRRSALHIATSENQFGTARLLVEAGADILVRDRWGVSPLQEAIALGNDDLVAYFESALVARGVVPPDGVFLSPELRRVQGAQRYSSAHARSEPGQARRLEEGARLGLSLSGVESISTGPSPGIRTPPTAPAGAAAGGSSLLLQASTFALTASAGRTGLPQPPASQQGANAAGAQSPLSKPAVPQRAVPSHAGPAWAHRRPDAAE